MLQSQENQEFKEFSERTDRLMSRLEAVSNDLKTKADQTSQQGIMTRKTAVFTQESMPPQYVDIRNNIQGEIIPEQTTQADYTPKYNNPKKEFVTYQEARPLSVAAPTPQVYEREPSETIRAPQREEREPERTYRYKADIERIGSRYDERDEHDRYEREVYRLKRKVQESRLFREEFQPLRYFAMISPMFSFVPLLLVEDAMYRALFFLLGLFFSCFMGLIAWQIHKITEMNQITYKQVMELQAHTKSLNKKIRS